MRAAALALVLAVGATAMAVPACGRAPGTSKWSSHKGKVPFIVGWDAGRAAAAKSGKPLAIFFTADW